MSSGFFHFRHVTALATMLLLASLPGALSAADEARPRGRPIEFSDIEGESAGTNVFKARSPHANRLDFMEKSMQRDNVDMRPDVLIFSTSPTSSSQSANQKKSKRSKNDTTFRSSDEVVHRFIAREILKIPESELEADEKLTTLLDGDWTARDLADTNSAAGKAFLHWRQDRPTIDQDEITPATRPNRISSVEEGRPTLRTLVNDSPGYDTTVSRPVTLSDVFGPKKDADSALERSRSREIQQIQLDTFRKMLAPQPAPTVEPLSRAAMPVSPIVSPSASWSSVSVPSAVPSYNPGLPGAPVNSGGWSVPGQPGSAVPSPASSRPKYNQAQPIFSVPDRR